MNAQMELFNQQTAKQETNEQLTVKRPKQALALGQKVWTAGVNDEIAIDGHFGVFVINCLSRHASGDWGDLDEHDRQANDRALKSGEDRILSAYKAEGFPKIWIITEWDRSVTTVLFPHEY
jgi:hypothetical protein